MKTYTIECEVCREDIEDLDELVFEGDPSDFGPCHRSCVEERSRLGVVLMLGSAVVVCLVVGALLWELWRMS